MRSALVLLFLVSISPIAFAQETVPALDHIERLIERGDNRDAFKSAVAWANANKSSPQRDRCLFLIAQALYNTGDRVKAFYYLDELMDEYPDSDFFYRSLEKQYQIADRYLEGYRIRIFRIPMFRAYDDGIEMLYRIQQRSPGSPLAEKSLLRSADYYFDDRQYDFAADTYAAYLRSYPRSPQASRVRLRQAFSSYAQFRGPRFDATPVIDAREQLRSVIATDDRLAAEENVPTMLEQIDRDLARKLVATADFYRRTHEPRGAAYTYRYLLKAFPETPEAQYAQVRLNALPQWAVRETPEPAITPGFAPGSPPPEEVRTSAIDPGGK
jgi:outer membrane protein assembly factor BamD (BamD/ComL family)